MQNNNSLVENTIYVWHCLTPFKVIYDTATLRLVPFQTSEKNNNASGDSSAKVPIPNPNNILLPVSVPTLWRQYADTAAMKHRTDQSKDAIGTESIAASSVGLEKV